MEVLRRVILFLGISIGVVLVKFVTLSPLVGIEPVDFAKEQQRTGFFTTEKEEYLRQLPLEKYIEITTRDHLDTVQGSEWESFFNGINRASQGNTGAKDWSRRISREQSRWNSTPYTIFFNPGEPLIKEALEQVAGKDNESRYLLLENSGQKRYLKLSYWIYDSNDFAFGSSGVDYGPVPPASLFYPYRNMGLGLILLSVLIYFLLPGKKREAGAIYYKRWGLIFGDFAAMLLFVPFFILPMFIIGGAVQAVLYAWPITMVMWPISLLGAWLLLIMARYASYTIMIRENGIELETVSGKTLHQFGQIESMEPLQLKPPRWLVALLALAALSGRGSQSALAGGQALMLAGSEYRGIGLRKRDGSSIFLWLTNQMGKSALNGAERIIEALSNAGVKQVKEVRVIKSMLMPDGEGPGGKKQRSVMNWIFLAIVIIPFAAMAITGLYILTWKSFADSYHQGRYETPEELAAIKSPPLLEEARPVRSIDIRAGLSPLLKPFMPTDAEDVSNTYASGITGMQDNGFLLFGCAGPALYLDGYLVKTNSEGDIQWQGFYGVEGKSSEYILESLELSDGSVFCMGTSGALSSIQGGQRAWFVGISPDGQELWQLHWGDGKEYPTPSSAVVNMDGHVMVVGYKQAPTTSIFILEIDGHGELRSEKEIDLKDAIGTGFIRQMKLLTGEEIILTGEKDNSGNGFKDLLAMKLSELGEPIWTQSFGSGMKETGQTVHTFDNGDILFAGKMDSLDAFTGVYLVKTDAQGNKIWEKTMGETGECSLVDILVEDDEPGMTAGNFIVLADQRSPDFMTTTLVIQEFDGHGNVLSEKKYDHSDRRHRVKDGLLFDEKLVLLGNRTWGHNDQEADMSLIEISR